MNLSIEAESLRPLNPPKLGDFKILVPLKLGGLGGQFMFAFSNALTIPLSKVNLSASNAISVVPKEYDSFDEPIYEVFDQRQRKNREER